MYYGMSKIISTYNINFDEGTKYFGFYLVVFGNRLIDILKFSFIFISDVIFDQLNNFRHQIFVHIS